LPAVLGAGVLAPPVNRCQSEGFGGCAGTGRTCALGAAGRLTWFALVAGLCAGVGCGSG